MIVVMTVATTVAKTTRLANETSKRFKIPWIGNDAEHGIMTQEQAAKDLAITVHQPHILSQPPPHGRPVYSDCKVKYSQVGLVTYSCAPPPHNGRRP